MRARIFKTLQKENRRSHVNRIKYNFLDAAIQAFASMFDRKIKIVKSRIQEAAIFERSHVGKKSRGFEINLISQGQAARDLFRIALPSG